ncbi:MAG: hypothetical protein MSC30_06515 [Gaiellaceae bacterium MAG52_C11]|nr:hypothetical protein [Candidatus Gaiellasilicea maunaloa]
MAARDEFGSHRPRNPAAETAVERIDGPVLLVSGVSDEVWPSAAYAAAIVERRKAAGLATTSLTALYAGDFVGIGLPNTAARVLGGRREADAALRAHAWTRVLAVLRSL